MGLTQNEYLIDTNILIDYLADLLPSPGIEIVEEIIFQSLNISVITEIEFLGWRNHTPQSRTAAEEIIKHASIMNLTQEVVNDTIALKQQMLVKTPDAIIASTSRIHQMTLITGNENISARSQMLLSIIPGMIPISCKSLIL